MKRTLTIVLVLCSLLSRAQPTVNEPVVTLDTNAMLIGEQIKLNLELWHYTGDSIAWPAFGDKLTEFVEVIDQSKIDTAFDEEDVMLRSFSQQVTITAFDTGYLAIPPIQFGVAGNAVQSDPFLFRVHSMPLDSVPMLTDIKAPIQVPFSFGEWLGANWYWVVLGIAATAGVVWLILWFSRRKPAPTAPVGPVERKLDPHVVALRKLEDLDKRKVWQQGDSKAFHSELTEIFREYLENRYRIPALEQTTSEIMASLRRVPIREDVKQELHQLLLLSDLVKFAKEQPIATENEQAMDNVTRFVRMTIPPREERGNS